jgi:hypothetical protein
VGIQSPEYAVNRARHIDRVANPNSIVLVGICPSQRLKLQSAITDKQSIMIPDFWIRAIFNQGTVEVLVDFECNAHFDGGHTWTERASNSIQTVYNTTDIDGDYAVFGSSPGSDADPPNEDRFERLLRFDCVRVVSVSLSSQHISHA